MTRRKLLRLVFFFVTMIGGVLLLRSGLDFHLSLRAILTSLVPLLLGFLSVLGAFYAYTRRYSEGGFLCVTVGALGVLLVKPFLAGILVLLGGVLILASSARWR